MRFKRTFSYFGSPDLHEHFIMASILMPMKSASDNGPIDDSFEFHNPIDALGVAILLECKIASLRIGIKTRFETKPVSLGIKRRLTEL